MKLRQTNHKNGSTAKIALVCAALTCNQVAADEQSSQLLRNPDFRDSLRKLVKKYNEIEATTVQISEQERQGIDGSASEPVDASASVDPLATAESAESIEETYASDSRFVIGEELVFDLFVAEYKLGSIFSLKTKNSVAVGLNQFIQLLQMPIQLTKEFKSASGWVFEQKNEFSMKTQSDGSLTVTVNGKTSSIPADAVTLLEDDIYIEIEYLRDFFLFSYIIDESKLAINLTSTKKFPAEERLARKNRTLTNQNYNAVSQMPYRETGYALYSPPVFDATISSKVSSSDVRTQYSILGSHDLAYFKANYYLNGKDEELLEGRRLTLSRISPENKLLGPLKATELEFGDIVPVSTGGISTTDSNSGLSRGVRFSNTPLSLSLDQQKVNLVGDVPNEWDVELRRNGVLLGQILDVQDGRYSFSDIQLDFGDNIFELVFYGPQGQVETKTQTYTVDGNSISGGKFGYQFSVAELGKSLLGGEGSEESNQPKSLRTDLATAYGVTDWLNLTAGFGQTDTENEDKLKQHSVGVSSRVFNLGLLNASLIQSSNDDKYTNYGFRTSVLGNALSLSQGTRLFYPISSSTKLAEVETTSVQLNGQLFSIQNVPISYSNTWNRNSYNDNLNESFTNSLAVNTKAGSFSHSISSLKVRRDVSDTVIVPVVINESQAGLVASETNLSTPSLFEQETGLVGGLGYRNNFYGAFARASINYSIEPTKKIQSGNLGLSYYFDNRWSANMDLSYLTATKSVSGSLLMNWKIDDYSLSALTSYNEVTGWSAGLSARFGFGYAPEANQLFSSRSGVTGGGIVSARVFEDTNLNGVFDENEKPIQDAEVVSKIGGERRAKTNEDGIAILSGISPMTTTDIVVDSSTLNDISSKTLIPGVGLTARSGRLDHIDFPVTKTGELEGVVYQRSEQGELVPAAFVQIQLVNMAGDVVETTQSEYDGYYLFTQMTPGNYRVMIEPISTRRLGLRAPHTSFVKFKGGDLLDGSDIQLERRENVQGYSANMGSFNSLAILRVYWNLLRKSGMNVARLKPFYLQDEESGKYLLSAGFFKEQQLAEQVCNRIKGRKLTCVVTLFDTNL